MRTGAMIAGGVVILVALVMIRRLSPRLHHSAADPLKLLLVVLALALFAGFGYLGGVGTFAGKVALCSAADLTLAVLMLASVRRGM